VREGKTKGIFSDLADERVEKSLREEFFINNFDLHALANTVNYKPRE
jgi:hypothetical protein